ADISAELARIQAHNEQARRQAAHHARRAERDAAEAQARALTVQLAALDDEVEATLTASEIGRSVPGLSFAAGDLLHEGIPFSQASGMRRLELSALIGMAANPRLRIMCIDEGDQLDDAAMARLRDLAKARDYQVWMTAIRAGDEHDADTCLIRINNGTAEGGSCLPALSASCTMSPEALPGLSLDL
ncbi:MAG TPA: hypothetical protein VLM89_13050, partial [Phycisphaerae bacterium]|nr:hypothetical protein [Phycisphaerae bacterium]